METTTTELEELARLLLRNNGDQVSAIGAANLALASERGYLTIEINVDDTEVESYLGQLAAAGAC